MPLKNAIRLQAIIITVALCSGCVSGSGGPLNNVAINQNKPVFVEFIADASDHADDTNIDSGLMAEAEFRDQLVSHKIPVTSEPKHDGYILKARYTQWEDHATQWTGVSDVVKMSVELIDNTSHKPVAQVRTKVLSSWFTFVNHSPTKLIPDVTNLVLKRIYGW